MDIWIDENACLNIIKHCPHLLRYVKTQTFNVCMTAVRIDGTTLQHIRHEQDAYCIEALKQTTDAQKYIQSLTPAMLEIINNKNEDNSASQRLHELNDRRLSKGLSDKPINKKDEDPPNDTDDSNQHTQTPTTVNQRDLSKYLTHQNILGASLIALTGAIIGVIWYRSKK